MKSCAFTGHRPQKLPFGFFEEDERCLALKETLRTQIIRFIEEEGVTHFLSGMALGVDMYAAELVLALKETYPQLTLEAAIPCQTQPNRWSVDMKKRYHAILNRCDKETLLQATYTPGCMERRNRYMVDHADFLLAVWDGTSSGTGSTVRYARRQKKPITIIQPESLQVDSM